MKMRLWPPLLHGFSTATIDIVDAMHHVLLTLTAWFDLIIYIYIYDQQWGEGQELNPDQIKAVLLDSAGFHGMLWASWRRRRRRRWWFRWRIRFKISTYFNLFPSFKKKKNLLSFGRSNLKNCNTFVLKN